MAHAPPSTARQPLGDLAKLSVAALGVVYGDIGTSPLYALKECFTGEHGIAVTPNNVLGVVSLVFWSLTLVIVLKYLSFVMIADHHGEGGILALLALVIPKSGIDRGRARNAIVIMLGLFGAALLYGDGMITPAISVLSAVEGLEIATDVFHPYIVPITTAILISLFLVQKRGTGGIGAIFGPAMILWFGSIGLLGLRWIVKEPAILAAINPAHAAGFLLGHGFHGMLVLGAVVLCITGGEALYADMGHFGKRPIRVAWYAIVFPALILNYFGQGALLISEGSKVASQPFYSLVPRVLLYPMVVVSTIATVIASQALISGAFSLTRQASQLGYLPRVNIVHTSGKTEGQIYVPEVNSALMIACVALVLVFKESTNLAAAYGVAVTGTMSITSILFYMAMKPKWGALKAGILTATFLIFDLAFFGANIAKIPSGGWIPLVIATLIFLVMTTWKRGRTALAMYINAGTLPLEAFILDVSGVKPHRVPGTAVFMSLNPNSVPSAMLHNFKHNRVIHEQVVVLAITTDNVPEVPDKDRIVVKDCGQGFFQVIAHYGFMQTPNVPEIMLKARLEGIQTNPNATSYFLARETLVTTGRSGMPRWRIMLFVFLSKNARSPTAFFSLPANSVVELGMHVEL